MVLNFIIFDLEASCGWMREERQSEIIEIGAVKLNNKLEIVDEFQSFIRPILNPQLTYFCEELTTIKQVDVDSAYTFDIVCTQFERWCRKSLNNDTITFQEPYWLCSWGFYDRKMLLSDCKLHGKDTNWIKHHISLKHQHGEMIGINKGIGMDKALAMYDLKLDGTHHRAISDAKNITKIFIEIFPHLKFK
jgi:3'-5' exoribonuclease 1